MEISSNVPASPMELSIDSPFSFIVGGVSLSLAPLTLHDYITVNKKVHKSLIALSYYDLLDANKKGNETSEIQSIIEKNGIDKSHISYLANVIIELCDELSPIKRFKLYSKWNMKHWWNPKKWVWDFQQWLERNLSVNQLISLVSYFVRYSSEVKKKIVRSLTEGIESATQDPKVTTYHSTDEESMWDSLSPGGIADIAVAHG